MSTQESLIQRWGGLEIEKQKERESSGKLGQVQNANANVSCFLVGKMKRVFCIRSKLFKFFCDYQFWVVLCGHAMCMVVEGEKEAKGEGTMSFCRGGGGPTTPRDASEKGQIVSG